MWRSCIGVDGQPARARTRYRRTLFLFHRTSERHVVAPLVRGRHRGCELSYQLSYVLGYLLSYVLSCVLSCVKRQPVAPFSTRTLVAGAGLHAIPSTRARRQTRRQPLLTLSGVLARPPSAGARSGTGYAVQTPSSLPERASEAPIEVRGSKTASGRRCRDLSAAGAVGPQLNSIGKWSVKRPRSCPAPYAGSGWKGPGYPAPW